MYGSVELPDVESDGDDDNKGNEPMPGPSLVNDSMTEESACHNDRATGKRKWRRIVVHSDSDEDNDVQLQEERKTPQDVKRHKKLGDIAKGEGDDEREKIKMPRDVKHHKKKKGEDNDEREKVRTPQKAKHQKRRWTEHEVKLLLSSFGREISSGKMPTGVRIAELARQMRTRTIPQIRTQLSNYIKGSRG